MLAGLSNDSLPANCGALSAQRGQTRQRQLWQLLIYWGEAGGLNGSQRHLTFSRSPKAKSRATTSWPRRALRQQYVGARMTVTAAMSH